VFEWSSTLEQADYWDEDSSHSFLPVVAQPATRSEEEEQLERAIRASAEEWRLQSAIEESLKEMAGVTPAPTEYEEERALPCGRREEALAPGLDARKAGAALWEQAQLRAEHMAEVYAASAASRANASSAAAKRASSVPSQRVAPTAPLLEAQVPSSASAFSVPPPGAGEPLDVQRHERVLQFAARASNGLPGCWRQAPGKKDRPFDGSVIVDQASEEFEAVAAYFLQTLGAPKATVLKLTRLQRPSYAHYSPRGGETVMFHGCRSQANENSIIRNGFLISRCVSGGSNFGTWFAYGAAYSNGGYVFMDGDGRRHIFVCVVSYQHTVKDDRTMRVVGQNCAYPLWLLEYRLPVPEYRPPVQRAAIVSKQMKPRQPGGAPPPAHHVVLDGRWVLEEPARRPRP